MGALITALNQAQISTLGLSMPLLAPAWAPNNVNGNFTIAAGDRMTINLAPGANWAAPSHGYTRRIASAADFNVTLIRADGTSEQPPGLLFTIPLQAWLRLCRYYVQILETAQPNRPEQARGLSLRPVPRYFYYAGSQAGDKNGNIEAWESLDRDGDMRIYDSDGLPIDPVAVLSALGALMEQRRILQNTPLATQFQGQTPLTALSQNLDANTTTLVRLVTPSGQPYDGTHLTGLTAVDAARGLHNIGGPGIGKDAPSASFSADDRNRLWLGPATTGRLADGFQTIALPGGIALRRDFYSVRVVELNKYINGTPNPADEATPKQPPPPVRINEPLNLLTSGNQILAAANDSLTGAAITLAVAPTIDGAFNVPAGGNFLWPAFPGVVANPNDPAPAVNLRNQLTITAQWFNDGNPNTPDIDIVLTIAGLPPNTWIRVYPRKLLPDMIEARGDGQGRLVPGGGTVPIRLTDPLGLRRPQDVDPATVSIPATATLRFDLMLVQANLKGRMYGNLSAPVQGTTNTDPNTAGTNPFNAAQFRGLSQAGILGLRGPAQGPFPNTFAGFLQALTNDAQPREAPRLPTMARRNLLVAGKAGANWRGVIGAGRLHPEIHSAQAAIGAPGSLGGRETQAAGVSTQNGRLAYDIASAALRHSTNFIFQRMTELNDPNWTLPNELAPPALGAPPTANAGTFAGAILENIAPYCETPDFRLGIQNFNVTPDDVINFIQNNIPNIPPNINNILNSLKSGNVGTLPQLKTEFDREIPLSFYGRRDSLWALQDAIQRARHFIYIESPGFCTTVKRDYGGQPVPDYAVDLISLLFAQMVQCPGLHVIIGTQKFPDFAPGYEPLAAYEAMDRRRSILGGTDGSVNVPSLPLERVAAFHPVGFPGRPSRLESHVVIIDDVWALVGSSSFRRRGFTFDGSYDIVFTDAQIENGRCPTISAFRRMLQAQRLGINPVSTEPTFVRLNDGVESFYAFQEALKAGGLGKLERLWSGKLPGVPDITPAPIDQANPDGREFDLATAIALTLLASFSGL